MEDPHLFLGENTREVDEGSSKVFSSNQTTQVTVSDPKIERTVPLLGEERGRGGDHRVGTLPTMMSWKAHN